MFYDMKKQDVFNEEINHDNCKFFAADLNQKWPIPDSKVDCFIAMMLFQSLIERMHQRRG